jgi:tRNA-Thr(GGU) m(6)t(6)A37 methyltransferase TsaA
MPALEPIGVARTPFLNHDKVPRQGGPARIELYPEYEPGLEGLERNTHVWVLGWFDAASRSVRARGRNAPAGASDRGVFAMRSPSRPNPIALSAARVLSRQGPVLHLDRLDFRDGTPVLDLKPYSPGWDLIPSAVSGHRYDAARYERQELHEALARDACNALGPAAMERPAVQALVHALLRAVFDEGVDIRSACCHFVLARPDERVEVLLCAAGAGFGNGRISIQPDCEGVAIHLAP